ncbi:hypothetical protein [Paenibacillus sp. HB172176]|uniref:hypothetical protein n=1 Tax=Paenibacillus sp. HB172176 TaxID=2493690 RepID=UPI00143B001E|nr:hypothetical protein [Paenibacillus sp. HB172176]
MNKYQESMEQTLTLSDTCLEGIDHIKRRLSEGTLESTVPLFSDLVEAFFQMERSISVFKEQLPPNHLAERSDELREAIDHVVTSYESSDSAKAKELIHFNLYPCFKKWKRELHDALEA